MVSIVDALDLQIGPLDKELRAYARRQPGCRALRAHYGIGELTAPTILCEGEIFNQRRRSDPIDGSRNVETRFPPLGSAWRDARIAP